MKKAGTLGPLRTLYGSERLIQTSREADLSASLQLHTAVLGRGTVASFHFRIKTEVDHLEDIYFHQTDKNPTLRSLFCFESKTMCELKLKFPFSASFQQQQPLSAATFFYFLKGNGALFSLR